MPHAGTIWYHRWQVIISSTGWYDYVPIVAGIGIEAQFSTCWGDFVSVMAEFAPVDSSCWLVRNRTKYHSLFHFLVRFRTDLSQLLEQFQTDYRYYSWNSWYGFVPIIAGTDFY